MSCSANAARFMFERRRIRYRNSLQGLRAVAPYSHDMCMCMYDACQRVQHIFNTPSKLQNTSGERYKVTRLLGSTVLMSTLAKSRHI